ncbi:AAA family ATPase [Actinoplanes sp. Pm04-4]|uniref:AAA family ATPase n=1 Tax=Paractinoplanes pyxinae TaxID=2997416 RepID=A0ABT4BC00_9ACTN|nr:AAA family ATPase [Actinoplanes pyxinae]MCY1143100.1 AAA family ATPase [Actinoplanes pyxinae]
MPAGLRVWTLGDFRVEVAGRLVPDGEWRRSGATALVKLLVLRRRLHREEAVDLLWPEADADVGVRRLNKALHFARRVLGADRLRQRDGMLALAPADLWTDVDSFEDAARRGDVEAALALYVGDLLPENRFDDWTEPRRTQLRDSVVSLLFERSARSEPHRAEVDLVRLIAFDPLHEEAYGRLIRLEAERGHRHLALRWYDRLAARLRADLGVEPRHDLQRLHRSLIESRPADATFTRAESAPGTTIRPREPGIGNPIEPGSARRPHEHGNAGHPPETDTARHPHEHGNAGHPPETDSARSPHEHGNAGHLPALTHSGAGGPPPETDSARSPHEHGNAGDPPETDTARRPHEPGGVSRSTQKGARISEERKLVTVLDADLRGVRRRDADPENARRETAEWTALLREIVVRWGGAVQPVVGGGVIGVFGYPTAREDHADRALRAGAEILRRFDGPIRLGVDSGQIIAPDELWLIGGAVLDTAARLRAAAAPRTLLAAERTRRAADQTQFRFGEAQELSDPQEVIERRQVGELQELTDTQEVIERQEVGEPREVSEPQGGRVVGERHHPRPPDRRPGQDAGELLKAGHPQMAGVPPKAGKLPQAGEPQKPDGPQEAGAPLIARRLLSVAPDGSTDARRQHEAPMIGRAGELTAVLGLIDEAVTTRQPRLITVTGVAGIGKTRLVREAVACRPGLRVLHGRCLAAGSGITYWALGEILREACGIPLGDTAGAPQRLRSRLTQVFAGQRLSPDELEATVFALATTAAIRLPDNPLDQADPRDVADELGRAWPRLATAFADRGPLLLVVEDLHWAGAPLVGMLSRLVTRSAGPVVLLTTARPEFLESRPDLPDVSMVSLRSLPSDDSRALLDALPQAVRLDPRRRTEILTRAEGNPYFLGQLAAHLAENAGGGLPDTLHALLAARVDALPAGEKRLLQAAAVMGRVFWTTPLRVRLGPDLPGLLSALESRGLVRARPSALVTGQDEYAFQHALLRDVAYASLPVAERAAGHAEVAAWLEEVSRERIGEVIELVAVHYAAAADVDEWTRGKAFRSLITAGVSARRRYAVPRALDLHRTALRHASNPAERATALEALGDDHETAYDGDKAVRAWRDAITALRDAPGHGDRRAALCLKTAQMVVARWGGFREPADPALGDRVIDEGLAVVIDPPTKAQLLALRALCGGRWAWTGRIDPVRVEGRRRAAADAETLAGQVGSPTLRAMALLGRAAVHFQEGRYDDAVTAVLDEVKLVEQEGSQRDRALGHLIASLVVGDVRGDYRTALDHAHQSYGLARELSPHDRLHGTALVMICLEQLGRDAEIDPYVDEHLRLRQGPVAAMSCPYIRSGPLVAALVLARRGDRPEAVKVAATVEPDLVHPGNAEVLRARLALQRGDIPTARSLAERLVALDRRPGPEEIPHEALIMLQVLEAAGDHDALRRFLPRARRASGYLALLEPACDRAEAAARA